MRVLLVDPDASRRDLVLAGLAATESLSVLVVESTLGLMGRVESFKPDVIIVSCESPARDAIDDLRRVSEATPRPIVMFVDRGEETKAADALSAGVAAYVVNGLEPSRVSAIIDVATAQFKVSEGLRQELARARSDLADRKLIDRAKGLLMARRKLSEPDAYAVLRKAAMDRGKTLSAIAKELIEADQLLGGLDP